MAGGIGKGTAALSKALNKFNHQAVCTDINRSLKSNFFSRPLGFNVTRRGGHRASYTSLSFDLLAAPPRAALRIEEEAEKRYKADLEAAQRDAGHWTWNEDSKYYYHAKYRCAKRTAWGILKQGGSPGDPQDGGV